MTQKMVESQVWRSIFRHGYPDTPLNQSLVMMGNVFLHLHPVQVTERVQLGGRRRAFLCHTLFEFHWLFVAMGPDRDMGYYGWYKPGAIYTDFRRYRL